MEAQEKRKLKLQHDKNKIIAIKDIFAIKVETTAMLMPPGYQHN